MNDVGKPCAGEPHARFERGPLAKREQVDDARETRGASATNSTHTDQPAAYLTRNIGDCPRSKWELSDDANSFGGECCDLFGRGALGAGPVP
jgi:hypothetical protein